MKTVKKEDLQKKVNKELKGLDTIEKLRAEKFFWIGVASYLELLLNKK